MRSGASRLRTCHAPAVGCRCRRPRGCIGRQGIRGHLGDVSRFPNADHFASYTGTSPLDASSGNRNGHRLNTGDRQLSKDQQRPTMTTRHTGAIRSHAHQRCRERALPGRPTIRQQGTLGPVGLGVRPARKSIRQASQLVCVASFLQVDVDVACRGRVTSSPQWPWSFECVAPARQPTDNG
ncbi:transposase [Actinoplanes sp. NPDC049599]|uniref:transposase n=1 Tax=Actinoplanes sp. NPDC049599 TaxID=3363903 RepID=UPI00378C1CD6